MRRLALFFGVAVFDVDAIFNSFDAQTALNKALDHILRIKKNPTQEV